MTEYHAKRLPTHLGPAAWNSILEKQPAPRQLVEDISVDFAIVGAGFAGLAAARRLTQLAPGSRIALLDAGRVAEGASGRNSGFMIDLPHELTSNDYAGSGDDRKLISFNRQAQAFAAGAVEDYEIRPDFFDACGRVNGAAGPAADARNDSYKRHLDVLGEPSELLDGQQMTELTGSHHYISGLYTPGTVVLQPAGYVRGFADGIARSGVSMFENSPVKKITREGTAWRLATPDATVRATKAILTVNGHLESFGIERGRLIQLFLFAGMTPELDANALARLGGQSRWGITPSAPTGTTVRRIDRALGGNRIVARTCAVVKPDTRPSRASLARAARVLQRKFDQRFPQLAGVNMEHVWAGHLCLSMNRVAVMREIEPNLFSGCVQNGLGTARGTLTGIGAAELACGVTSDITKHFTAEDRPGRLPPQPFQQLGANALIRWKEWRARDE
ncbi:MAG: NAD(P)/FAD-dependent oxidoreductase [Boseongicola sp.]